MKWNKHYVQLVWWGILIFAAILNSCDWCILAQDGFSLQEMPPLLEWAFYLKQLIIENVMGFLYLGKAIWNKIYMAWHLFFYPPLMLWGEWFLMFHLMEIFLHNKRMKRIRKRDFKIWNSASSWVAHLKLCHFFSSWESDLMCFVKLELNFL